MKTLLWLDDSRDPFENLDWLIFSPIGRDVNVVWCQSYEEFDKWTNENGLPDAICFDHDLGEDNDERNGYDAAKKIVDMCMNEGKPMIPYSIQSANPVGRENIEKYIENFKKQYERN